MNLPREYKTGNQRFDEKVAAALAKHPLKQNKIQQLLAGEAIETPKQNKYGVGAEQDRTANGMTFDSIKEMNRYFDLCLQERAGEVSDLQRQVIFVLYPGFVDNQGKRHRPITYIMDHVYVEKGEWIAEDVKDEHTRTQVYMLKKKLFLDKWRQYKFKEVC